MSGDALLFIGDVHLEALDEPCRDFLSFLNRLEQTARRIVLMGDLFNLWLGLREVEQPYQTAVVRKLTELRRSGVVVRYLEGNRDYHVGPAYIGEALDDASEDGIIERFAGRELFAVHGDLANPGDRQYRRWRKLSRSTVVWWLFNVLPRRRRQRWAEALERRMRRTNLGFKREFPEAAIRAYAAPYLAAGHDAVVLGHFHVEKELRVDEGSSDRRILVLPEWKESRRHLQLNPDGEMCFVDSEY
jgi:UDP-2,3-diacylglucosamine hydrolase